MNSDLCMHYGCENTRMPDLLSSHRRVLLRPIVSATSCTRGRRMQVRSCPAGCGSPTFISQTFHPKVQTRELGPEEPRLLTVSDLLRHGGCRSSSELHLPERSHVSPACLSGVSRPRRLSGHSLGDCLRVCVKVGTAGENSRRFFWLPCVRGNEQAEAPCLGFSAVSETVNWYKRGTTTQPSDLVAYSFCFSVTDIRRQARTWEEAAVVCPSGRGPRAEHRTGSLCRRKCVFFSCSHMALHW